MTEIIEAEVDGALYKSHVIVMEPGEAAGSSSQPSDDPDLGTPNDALPPPESLERLALWSAINGTRSSCISAIATNTVGLGYELEVAPEHARENDDPDEQIRAARSALEGAAARDTRLHQPTFTELLKAVKTDEEEVGWGFMEVSRNREDGKIDGLYHLPGKRMRRLKSRKGYLLMPPSGDWNDATYFAPFGTKVNYDSKGQPTNELADGHTGGWRKNEVIVFKLYTSESRDYGLPRDNALAVEYLGDKLANESNAAFFENGGSLPTVLFVQGEESRDGGNINVNVPGEVTERINAVMRSKGRGPSGSSRLAIVPLPAGVKASKEVLGAVDNRDMGFVLYRDDMRQRTLSAFRLGPIFIALSDEGREQAEVQRALAKEQLFNGEQTRYQTRLAPVLNDIGFPRLAISLNDLAVEDDAAKRSSAEKMAEHGTITRREDRAAHGYTPLPEAAQSETEIEWDGESYKSEEPEPGHVPFGWNDRLVKVGLPNGAENRVAAGDGQPGERPGLAGRSSRDKGQAASAAERQVTRLAGRGAGGAGGAKRALARARALPEQ